MTIDVDLRTDRVGASREVLAAARAPSTGGRVALAAGTWTPPSERPQDALGLLVVEGALIRRSVVAGRTFGQVLGPGDAVDPWAAAPGVGTARNEWRVLERSTVLLVDRALLATPRAMHTVMRSLFANAERMHELAATAHLGTEQRLLNVLWALAPRFGRVTHDGVLVPFLLTHGELGELVGARRTTVTLALGHLAATDHVRRHPRGWVLAHDAERMEAVA